MTPISSNTFLPEALRERITPDAFGELPVRMFASDASAKELVATRSGAFGADLLRFPAAGGVPMHTHPGDHILMVLGGSGKLLCPEGILDLYAGLIYLVPSDYPHEIQATSDLVLVAVGNQRKPPGSAERLELV